MVNVNKLPTLDFEVGVPGSHKHSPVVVGQIVAGIAIGIVIAIADQGYTEA